VFLRVTFIEFVIGARLVVTLSLMAKRMGREWAVLDDFGNVVQHNLELAFPCAIFLDACNFDCL
jgi:hypothetical protein